MHVEIYISQTSQKQYLAYKPLEFAAAKEWNEKLKQCSKKVFVVWKTTLVTQRINSRYLNQTNR